ncbi:MAG: MopE-related protein [Myxococcota bacterium]
MRSFLLLLLVACSGGPDDKLDADGDGYPAGEDCDDGNTNVHPGATEVCDAGDVDEDCSGAADNADPDAEGGITVFRDTDADGYGAGGSAAGACEATDGYSTIDGDCDDADPRVNPDADEACDDADADEDCDGLADDADPDATGGLPAFRDEDGDGFGDPAETGSVCDAGDGWVADDTDCDDGAAFVHPGADELCDEIDDDCDGAVDEDGAVDAPSWFLDDDADGHGDAAVSVEACVAPTGHVAAGTDCDDLSSAVHPGADERCDGEDDDCDGTIDEDDAIDVATWYRDTDGDGHGDATSSTVDCDAPEGYVAGGADCDDGDAAVSPAATEACDAADLDDDCDGVADDADSTATGKTGWYADADGDGYGDAGAVTAACDLPGGHVANDDDCDDASTLIRPGAAELCDATNADEDCDGLADDADPSVDSSGYRTWYADADVDGYGATGETLARCDAPSGYAPLSTDCDDTNAARSPGNAEVCDAGNTDEDCDGLADDADGSVSSTSTTTWYADLDGDDYGDVDSAVARCDRPASHVGDAEDCDDGDDGINPGEVEVCGTTADENCDGIGLCDATVASADRTFTGAGLEVQVGFRLDGAGDLDGDGLGDLIFSGREGNGTAWTVLGGGVGDRTTASLDGTFEGESEGDYAGYGVAGLGDVDGDGLDDVAVAAHGDDDAGANYGAAYILRGPATGTASLADAHAKLTGRLSGSIGLYAVGGVGDVDGDGLADLGTNSGDDAYLFTGIIAGTTAITSATATFTAETVGDRAGEVIDGIGDSDGDGFDDFVIAAPYLVPRQGAVYLVLGPVTGTVPLSLADGKRSGTAGMSQGYALSGGGDINGDGYPDVASGGNGNYTYEENSVFVLPGPLTGTATMASTGIRIRDMHSNWFGCSVAMDGDFDGDGTADLIVGDITDRTDGEWGGAIEVFFGPLAGSLTPDDSDITITPGAAGQMLGQAVAYVGWQGGAGDAILFGAPYNSASASWGGAAYLFSVESF